VGPQGFTGGPGAQGQKGATGATGPQGPQGSAGIDLTSDSVITVPAMLASSSTSATQIFSAAIYRLIRVSGSFAGNITLQVSNLTQGRFVEIFIQNTNASARTITLQASTTAASYAAPGFTVVGNGAASTNTVVLAATTGCAYFYVTNSLGNIIAFRQ
jgi:hypothetical protein